jgi:hypothetical protein
VRALQSILSLYQSGATTQANTSFASYQKITGDAGFQNAMGSIDTVGDKVQQYSQGAGLLNQGVNQLTKNNTAAYIAGGIGLTALGGAFFLAGGSSAAVTSVAPKAVQILSRIGPYIESVGESTSAADYQAAREAAEYGKVPLGLDDIPWAGISSTA